MKQVNIVYEAYPVESEVLYEDEVGLVRMSRSRKAEMHNVIMGGAFQNPNDSFLITEPVTVCPGHYDVNFLSQFRKVFGCFDKVFENSSIKDKFIKVNYGTESSKMDANHLRNCWLPWEQRNGIIVVASGNKQSNHPSSIYNLRIMLADMFYDNGFNVSWFGYTRINKPYYKGTIPGYDNKIKEMCKYKFSICTENTYDKEYSTNYMTEKLPHAIYAGTIPLYMGCYNIDEIAPKDVFFDLRNFVVNKQPLKEPLIEAMRNISKSDLERYNQAQYEYISNGIYNFTDIHQVYRKMLITL